MDTQKDKKDFSERTLNAQWAVDSETGQQYLIDLETGQILAAKNNNGEWINPE